jgi:hypothetical protein
MIAAAREAKELISVTSGRRTIEMPDIVFQYATLPLGGGQSGVVAGAVF